MEKICEFSDWSSPMRECISVLGRIRLALSQGTAQLIVLEAGTLLRLFQPGFVLFFVTLKFESDYV